jgi:subtilase family serine protease
MSKRTHVCTLALALALVISPRPASRAWAAGPLPLGAGKRPPGCELVLLGSQLQVAPDGAMVYEVKNFGQASCPAFSTDVYVGGVKKETLSHAALGAGAVQSRTTATRLAGCAAATVRFVADAGSQAAEADEANNQATRELAPPCPDLVPKLYATDEDGGLRYQVHVRVTNEGPVATPKAFLVLVGVVGLAAITPPLTKELAPLEPGESKTFSYGPKRLKTNPISVNVRADRGDWIAEGDEENNYASRNFGPH